MLRPFVSAHPVTSGMTIHAKPMLIDSHCHLDRLDLEAFDGSLDSAMHSARQRGVGGFLCVGISLQTMPAMMALIENYDDVYASVGHHPLEPCSQPIDRDELLSWARHDRVVAVGETGLDYFYQKETAAAQQQNFSLHLELAREVAKPVIVHSRDAREDTLSLLKQHAGGVGGVLHCFTEDWDMASRAIDLNFYISFSGIVTFRNASSLREVVKKVPLDRLLVETDAPYLAPVPYRGKPNQPAYVVEVAQCIAELKDIPLAQLAEQSTANFRQLFLSAA